MMTTVVTNLACVIVVPVGILLVLAQQTQIDVVGQVQKLALVVVAPLVSDVLAQIPISVTEQALRSQSYTGICGRAGKEMPPEKLLATFCQGNEVLVAIPAGVQAQECARLARPILSDSKVMQMVCVNAFECE